MCILFTDEDLRALSSLPPPPPAQVSTTEAYLKHERNIDYMFFHNIQDVKH